MTEQVETTERRTDQINLSPVAAAKVQSLLAQEGRDGEAELDRDEEHRELEAARLPGLHQERGHGARAEVRRLGEEDPERERDEDDPPAGRLRFRLPGRRFG